MPFSKKKAKLPTKFPHTVKSGSLNIKVYRIPNKQSSSRFSYIVKWYEGKGVLKEKRRVKLKDAMEFANDMADYLDSAKADADRLRKDQKEAYVLAQDLAVDTDVVTAIREWKKAMEISGGNIIAAAEAWRVQQSTTIKQVEISKIIELFQESKRRARVKVELSYAKTLPRFEKTFGKKLISTVTTRSLQNWLDGSFDHPVTRNTHRKRIVTMWRWAKAQGYLPRNVETEAELTHPAQEEAPEIGIIDANTYARLLFLIRDRHPHYLGALVLAGFCGMRRVEVHGQKWEDVLLSRRKVRVSHVKRGTPAKRLVTLCDAATEWLMIAPKNGEMVCPGTVLAMDRVRKIGRTAGLVLPVNCFRHSYFSCRVAASGELGKAALEGGTSEKMIHRHYRELVTEEEGQDWFSIRPDAEIVKVVGFNDRGE